jgi:hypothetical protein
LPGLPIRPGGLKAVAGFFEEHHTLTREQFLELIENSPEAEL